MPVSLEEFIKSFINTRRLIISGKMDWDTYLTLFRSGLEKGFLPEEIYEYMQENT